MDPLTSSMNAVTALANLGMRVWDAMSDEQKKNAASDWAKFTHGIGEFFTSVQSKINASVK